MFKIVTNLFAFFVVGCSLTVYGGQDTHDVDHSNDSVNQAALLEYYNKLVLTEKQRVDDSLEKEAFENRLLLLPPNESGQREQLMQQLNTIEMQKQARKEQMARQIDSLRLTVRGYPVLGVLHDTLFLLYAKSGASLPKERAEHISRKIANLYDDDFLKVDSIKVVQYENAYDVVYDELIIMSVSEKDAIWYGKSSKELAGIFADSIMNSIQAAKKENSVTKLIGRIGFVLLVIAVAWFIFVMIGRGNRKLLALINSKKNVWLKDLSYRDYTFLTADQEMMAVLFMLKIFRWLVYILLLYITLPIIFSIFPFSRTWADALFNLLWSPFKGVLLAVWEYLPNLFSILVIIFVMKYVNRFVRYVFHEIEAGKLKISGFHSDWAMPTYSIVRFLLIAFMFVLIFPYLPGSDSNIFTGVSVFIGVLFSLGSSSAIANMVAGLVITYMRPFKVGDRIKIGDVTGDVVEKTLLVTRLKTIKNEIVTIPNSSVLNGNTTNYSSEAAENGLIIHTTVTIGYDVPWVDMHNALIDAALRTDSVLHDPKPFVLQTGLEDFYVAYQINAYTREAGRQAFLYSQLHQNIQDVCNERGIEILSPHYRAARDGNMSTIPSGYLRDDYKPPVFQVSVEQKSEKKK